MRTVLICVFALVIVGATCYAYGTEDDQLQKLTNMCNDKDGTLISTGRYKVVYYCIDNNAIKFFKGM